MEKRKENGFQFKQFTIHDNRCAHKVGTDGTLLGAWVNTSYAENILDIGTGSGLVALMLAQRTTQSTSIEGIEISWPDFEQAKENIRQSPWPEKINIQHSSLQEFTPEKKFSCIVSNPPFFNNSFKPPQKSRVTPRHTDTLPYNELLFYSKTLLTENGKLNVILPNKEGLQFIELAKNYGLFVHRQWSFRTRIEKPIERWLLEFGGQTRAIELGEILLYQTKEDWSSNYKELTKDFYLKL